MASPPEPKYALVEADGFRKSVEALGSYRRLDDATTGLYESLCSSPEVYPVVEGMKDVRLCKTDDAGNVPGMRWWFRIDAAGERIELLWVEKIEDDNGVQ